MASTDCSECKTTNAAPEATCVKELAQGAGAASAARPAPVCSALRHTPLTGVLWAVGEATKRGFYGSNPAWCNLGQGQPEVGRLDGGPERVRAVDIYEEDNAYGPAGGSFELRHAIASHYNRLYRTEGMKKYTASNVSVAGGGHGVLARLFATLQGRVGYTTPEYSGFNDGFTRTRGTVEAVHLKTSIETEFCLQPAALRAAAKGSAARPKVDAVLMSNPCNPTGGVLKGKKLEAVCETARDTGCLMILDEFYSQYIYNTDTNEAGAGPVSAAKYVEDPETDPVIIMDGLTKNFRCPGWRVGWALGPSSMIDNLNRAACGLDGPPSLPAQRAALSVLLPEHADKEGCAIRAAFAEKRKLTLEALHRMGLTTLPCSSTFYVWGCVENLPLPLSDGLSFFHQALVKQVMVVPGVFFDLSPAGPREGRSACDKWVRFSFGPPKAVLVEGLARLEALVAEFTTTTIADKPPSPLTVT